MEFRGLFLIDIRHSSRRSAQFVATAFRVLMHLQYEHGVRALADLASLPTRLDRRED